MRLHEIGEKISYVAKIPPAWVGAGWISIVGRLDSDYKQAE
jgi:hypothetical protein